MKKFAQLAQGAKARGAAAVAAGFAAASAHAALPTEVTTGISDAGADMVTAGTAVLTAMIGFWAIRTIAKKMGWWGA